MTDSLKIRETTSDDCTQVLALYPLAFPEEELRPVVSSLLNEGPEMLSLAGFVEDALVGHVLFTICGTNEEDRGGALLAPLGVLPKFQRQGVGSMLVRAGLERLKQIGIRQVFVLGDPAYYGRLGFVPERQALAPYPIAEEWMDAWQSMSLMARAPLAAGRLRLPEAWMEPTLWAP